MLNLHLDSKEENHNLHWKYKTFSSREFCLFSTEEKKQYKESIYLILANNVLCRN